MMFRLDRYHKGVLLGCTIFLSALMFIMVQPTRSTPLTPATWTVNTTSDPGAPTCAATCSLRAAVNVAAPGDSIVFDASVFSAPLTITLQGQIEISKALTIDGMAGGGITPTLSGNHLTRTFQVVTGTTVMLKALNIVGGQARSGGGIYNSGWLTITDSMLSGNATDAGNSNYYSGGAGGGIFNSGRLFLTNSIIRQNQTGQGSPLGSPNGTGGSGGGIFNSGTLTITNSLVSENMAGVGGMGLGLLKGHGGPGGGIYNAGTLYIINSTLSQNKAGNGAGSVIATATAGGHGGDGGGVFNAGSLFISDSTVSGNGAGHGGASSTCLGCGGRYGGAGGEGGGIYSYGSDILSMTNTTVSDNLAGNGGRAGSDSNYPPGFPDNYGGRGGNGGGVVGDNLSMTNGTIAGNKAGNGGAGYTGGAGGSGGGVFSYNAVITNSTLSENATGIGGAGIITGVHGGGVGMRWGGTALIMNTIIANGSSENNCAAASFQADGGYNLDSGNTCGFTTTNHSLVNTDPLLGLLGDYGGPVQTVPLRGGSPAMDAIPLGENGCGTTMIVDARGVPRPQGIGCDIGASEQYYDYDLSLTPSAASLSGLPGSIVTFTLAVTNVGHTHDTLTITVAGNTFVTAAPASIGPLAAGAGTTFDVAVTIPGVASVGSHDTAHIQVTSQGDPTKLAAALLTTTVLVQVYLPLIINQP
jgi:hypothetical protein